MEDTLQTKQPFIKMYYKRTNNLDISLNDVFKRSQEIKAWVNIKMHFLNK